MKTIDLTDMNIDQYLVISLRTLDVSTRRPLRLNIGHSDYLLRSIITVDLAGAENPDTHIIGPYFLNGCEITFIDLSPLWRLVDIPNGFLSRTSISTLSLSQFTSVKSIHHSFLYGCGELISLDCSPLTNLEYIGDTFLNNCTTLRHINFEVSPNIRYIGNDFICNCEELEYISFPEETNIRFFGRGFMFGCYRLSTIDLRFLSKCTEVSDYFLAYCGGMDTINLGPLSNVTTIGHAFLQSNMLEHIDLTPFAQVKHIGRRFLWKSRRLKEIDIRPLANVKSVESECLSDCPELRIVYANDEAQLRTFSMYGRDGLTYVISHKEEEHTITEHRGRICNMQ